MATDPEADLPDGQKRLNRFCENWIFAFLVAFAIRHFCLEAFRIPSASMEPMLYGDAGITGGDFVVVDKLTQRFTGVRRWDVAVFQFPPPELEPPSGSGLDAVPAADLDGRRHDALPFSPAYGRNFVKRAVVVPGDVFYLAGGDLHLRQPDGSFRVEAKPDDLQRWLWMPTYRSGAQKGYRPWRAEGGAPADGIADDALDLVLADGQGVVFAQPLINLYIKPGKQSWVRPLLSQDAGEVVQADLLAPAFTYGGKVPGNVYDLGAWEVKRLTTRDLDSPSHGKTLNTLMNERVGDVRVEADLTALDGEGCLRLANRAGDASVHQGYDLRFDAQGWRLHLLGRAGDSSTAAVASGAGSLVGHRLSLTHCDGRVMVGVDGVERARFTVPDVDPDLWRLAVEWRGRGRYRVAGIAIDRDLHWSAQGFLREEAEAPRLEAALAALRDNSQLTPAQRDYQARFLTLVWQVRAQILGIEDAALTASQARARYAVSPQTAITAPAGAYLMLGDNSPHSWDGRSWGWVPVENYRGRALAVVFPFDRCKIVR